MTSRAILNGWPVAAGQAVRAAVTPAPTPTPSLPTFAFQAETLTLTASQSSVSARRAKSKDRAIARIKAEAGSAWSKLIGLYLIDDTEGNFRKNWKSPGTYDLTPVVGPTFTGNDGVTTTSNGRYYETGIPLTALPQDSHSVAIFSNSSNATASVEIGAHDGTGGISINPRDGSNKFVARMMSATYTSPTTVYWSGEGWTGYTRTGATTVRIQHHGIAVETATTASVTPPTGLTIRILGAAGNAGFSARSLAGAYITNAALTEAEESALCMILRDYIEKVRYGDLDIREAGFAPDAPTQDVVVYGCSPGAFCAAYEAARQGRTVAWVGDWVAESEWDFGGVVTSTGLDFIDANTPANVSGVFREFLRWINVSFYARADTSSQFFLSPEPRAWLNAIRRAFDPTRTGGILPGVAGVTLYLSRGLDSLQKLGPRFQLLKTKDGRTFAGRVLVGAEYDGQLTPLIGAPYIIGTEAAGTGGEALNGFKGSANIDKPFGQNIDPYVTPGVASSGLLPYIVPMPSIALNAPDPALESMNLRMTWANNRIVYAPFDSAPPPNYDPLKYEIIGRAFAANPNLTLANVLKIDGIGNGYTFDVNNGPGGYSTDLPQSGLRYGQTTTDDQRRAIFQEIQDFNRGLIYWLLYSNDARIPVGVKTAMQGYFLDARQYLETRAGSARHWPSRGYVRDPIFQMKNAGFVYNGVDLKAADGTVPRSIKTISLGNYNIVDRHNPYLVAYDDGTGMKAYVQGNISDTSYAGTDKLAPLPVEAILPDPSVCTNFFNVCSPSMTKIAWFFDRMEPTLGLAGQSAGMMAAMIVEADVDAAAVDYDAFRTRMAATTDNVKPLLPQVN